MQRKKSIVVVGGGTGTYTVLSGLKKYADSVDLSAVVAMTDSGGSTGRLRDEFGYLPVGDVRMALSALAHEDDENGALVRKLFLHRFASDGDIAGHNFGNLFLVALTDILGKEELAIKAASKVLRVCGTVIPVTHEKTHLVAEYRDGTRIVGEHHIDELPLGTTREPIASLSVEPKVSINEEAREALRNADLIVFGPGDLYTSVLANCVVGGFKEAIGVSKARIVYISNLMTKAGQTTHMGVVDHVRELERYIGREPDMVLVNETALPKDLLLRYAEENEFPVDVTGTGLNGMLYRRDLLATEEIVRSKGDVLKRSLIRHDSDKLATALYELLHEVTQ
jgi:uncharacterized cofD-like protein